MNKSLIITVIFLTAATAFADDPGVRDSLIIETVFADLGDSSVDVRIYATCDDSVGFYNMPLSWNSVGDSGTGIYPVDITYYYPITDWDHVWDSVFIAEQFIRMVGMTNGGDIDPPLITNNNRWHCWTIHFAIDSTANPQVVTIDTTYDPVNGSLLFGLFGGVISLIPDFTPGAIFYGITSDAGDDSRILPQEIALLRNYPNPFNATTTIEFTLPEAAFIDLSIYDLLGRMVAVLEKGIKPTGKYEIPFNSIGLSSGVYFYRLQAGDLIETKKMLLLR